MTEKPKRLIAKLDKQGRFTIPDNLRVAAGIKPSDYVSVQIDGQAVVVKKADILV